jgi:hypothetical protein
MAKKKKKKKITPEDILTDEEVEAFFNIFRKPLPNKTKKKHSSRLVTADLDCTGVEIKPDERTGKISTPKIFPQHFDDPVGKW